MKFRAKAVPNFFQFHRGTSPTRRDFNAVANYARNRKSKQHRQKNARPSFIPTPPRETCQRESEREVPRPIPKSADLAHQIVRRTVLMLRHEISHRLVEIKRRDHNDRSDHNPNQPIKNDFALHK